MAYVTLPATDVVLLIGVDELELGLEKRLELDVDGVGLDEDGLDCELEDELELEEDAVVEEAELEDVLEEELDDELVDEAAVDVEELAPETGTGTPASAGATYLSCALSPGIFGL